MSKIKIVIFDLDGVIVSTDKLHYKAWKKMADKENIYFDEIINNRLRGVSRMDSLEIILENANRKYSDEEKYLLSEYKNNEYKSLLETLTPDDILPFVNELLNELKKRKIIIAIGSSSKNAKRILEKIGLINRFDFISDGNNIKRSKPAPDVFKYVADNLNISYDECLVIEDARSGIDAAKNAKMHCAAISEAFGYEKTDISLHKITDVLDFIDKEDKNDK